MFNVKLNGKRFPDYLCIISIVWIEAGPVDAIKLGPGMSWTIDVKLYPVENTSEVTGNIKFITTHLDTTKRQFLVKFVATPCRAEPYIQPMKLT